MYEIRCIFCKRIHQSEFFDEIEEGILRCREIAADWQKGLLRDFDYDTAPIRPETAVAVAEAEAASYIF